MERPQKAPARSQLDEIYARAETHLAKGEHRKAIQDLERITKIDPRGPTGALAFFELGRLHREAGKLKKAEAAFRRAVHAGLSEPLLSRARLGMCAIAIRRQDSQRARACLSLIQSSPSKSTAARAAVLEAQVACMDGRFDIAERRFFRAMELSPPGARIDVEVRLGRVRCAIQQGALHRAETLLQGLKKSTRAHRTERRELEVIILREKKRKK